jgi:hypothetical protein
MRAFLRRRWRWLFGAVLGLVAFPVVVWLQSTHKEASEMAFDQVRLGMTLADVVAVMHLSQHKHREKVRLKELPWRSFPPDYASLVARWFGCRTIPDRFEVAYGFD